MRLPDPATLFADRAARLRDLAAGHTMADYLLFLARVVDAQAAAVDTLPAPTLRGAPNPSGFEPTLAWMLDHLDLPDAPQPARDAARAVSTMPREELSAVASGIMESAYSLDLVAETLFIAAALQVHLARLAAQLDPVSLQRAENGVCPACGGGPVSSLVVGWTQASKARYCACALCGTLWNYVRIKCTACGSTAGIAYYTIEDGDKTVGVETCTSCRSYIKHMQQHENHALDPVADDVASYALDLLAREQDFRRSSINPLFLTG